ncbi:hypothetical protein D8B29_26880 [Verminephrobacter eiseniae]|nr:hypothetical protein [Verminephrobacter eiseniae]MCW5302624.1 hypothetical protein [Verminephrobacter eiseniae]MCW8182996.1 hypothetical protein [Verminephrobacter eiseniae]MCW8192277.1 hypothetical protein [Verminephrobacter eiseniae]
MGRGVNSSAITPNHVAHPRHLRRGEWCAGRCGGWCDGRYGGLTPLRRHQPPIRAILRTPTWRHDRAIGANLNGRWYGIRRSRWGHRWRWPCWCWRTRCRWLRGRRARLRERNPRAIPACLQAIATLRVSARADANQILGITAAIGAWCTIRVIPRIAAAMLDEDASLRDPSSSSMTGFFARPDETARI